MNELGLVWSITYLAGSLIMVFVSVMLYFRHKLNYLPYWIGFWGILSFAYILGLFYMRFEWLILMMLFSGAIIFSGLLFLKSMYLYLKLSMRQTWLIVTTFVYLVIMVSFFTSIDNAVLSMWIYTFTGFFYIIAGLLLWRPSLYRQRFIGAIIIFFGLTVVFFPLLIFLSSYIYYSLFIIHLGGIGFTMSMIFLHILRLAHDDMVFKQNLYNLALNDALTGLYNRRYIDNEVNYFKAEHHPIGIIMCDLDNLKEINDQLGHQTGDQLLVKTATILKSVMPDNVILARYGGDEFVALLFNASKDSMHTYIDRLKQSFDKTSIHKKKIKISLGYALKDKDMSFDTALKKADAAMYQMKINQKST